MSGRLAPQTVVQPDALLAVSKVKQQQERPVVSKLCKFTEQVCVTGRILLMARRRHSSVCVCVCVLGAELCKLTVQVSVIDCCKWLVTELYMSSMCVCVCLAGTSSGACQM